MKTTIFVGAPKTGKSRVARMLADYLTTDTCTFTRGVTLMQFSADVHYEDNGDADLLIVDHCSADINLVDFFSESVPCRMGNHSKYRIRYQLLGGGPEVMLFSRVIFIMEHLPKIKNTLGSRFAEHFDVINFPLTHEPNPYHIPQTL